MASLTMNDTEMEDAPSSELDNRTHEGASAVRSIEGWIIVVTNVHEEAGEEEIQEMFGDYGEIKNVHMNQDRRTGYVKGYVLIQYSTLAEAKAAIAGTHGKQLMEQTLSVDFAFVRPPPKRSQAGPKAGRRSERQRSRSPGERRGTRDDDDEDGHDA